jgi:hypothetical protein
MLSWSDGHGTGADVDVVDGRCGNLPHRRRGGRGNASPLHGVGGGSAVDPRPASVGRCSPLCRGQALPDPPAQRAGNPTVRRSSRYRRNHARGRYTPRQSAARRSARWARRCLAPTRWAELPGRVPAGQDSAERPVLTGGRRCLTPRPAAAGKPDRGRSGYRGRVIHTGTFAGVHVATLPGAAPVDRSRVFLAPRAHQPVPTASPCRLLTASPLGEPRRLSG